MSGINVDQGDEVMHHQTSSHEVIETTTIQKSPAHYSASFATRTRVEPTGVGEELELNHRYFGTLPGFLKLLQVVSTISRFFEFF